MKLRRSAIVAMMVPAVMLFVAGCSGSKDTATGASATQSASSTSTAAARPTLTASDLQPPSQQNQYTADSGRPAVVFDPCTWVSDDTLRKAGFDPATRKRGDDEVAEQTFLICHVSSATRDLSMISGNVTWDDDLKKVGSYSEPTTINGRQALTVHDPTTPRGCQVDLRTKVGFVMLTVSLTDTAPLSLPPCQGITDIASAIEPEIGKDN